MKRVILILLLVFTRMFAWSPADPATKIYSAPEGRFIARVEPTIKKFADEPVGRAKLSLFRFSEEKKEFERTVTFDLENEIAPGEILLSSDGNTIVGIGDWYDWELTSPVIIFYKADGTVLKKLFLDDVLTKAEAVEARASKKRWYIHADLFATRLLIQRDPQVGGPGTYKKSVVVDPATYKVSEYIP